MRPSEPTNGKHDVVPTSAPTVSNNPGTEAARAVPPGFFTFGRRARVLLLIMAALTGCQSVDFSRRIPWSEDSQPYDAEVVKMTAIWEEASIQRAGEPAMRGFGGRIYFYNRYNAPIEVEGELSVYAFDDTLGQADGDRPDRRFVFTPEQLTGHLSTGQVGPSYSVWLPWDQIGGPQRDINLVPTFLPQEGQVVVGEEARQRLRDGNLAKNHMRNRSWQHPRTVRPVSYENGITTAKQWPTLEADMSQAEAAYPTQTTTISVPNTLKQQMQSAGNRYNSLPARHPPSATTAMTDQPSPQQMQNYRSTLSSVRDEQSQSNTDTEQKEAKRAFEDRSPSSRWKPWKPDWPASNKWVTPSEG